MKNLKKIALLLSIITVFVISCGGSQQALNSTFDIIEDGETSVPDNPPVPLDPDTGEPAVEPEDPRKNFFGGDQLWVDKSSFDKYVYGGIIREVVNLRGSSEAYTVIARSKISYQMTLMERTQGTQSAEEILKNINMKANTFPHKLQHFLNIEAGMANALNSSGQSAKIKASIFIEDSVEGSSGYKPGKRDIIVTVRRK